MPEKLRFSVLSPSVPVVPAVPPLAVVLDEADDWLAPAPVVSDWVEAERPLA